MRLIFAGTPDFAARALLALIRAGHEVALVLTQPDRRAGRGMQYQPSAVKTLAQQHGLRVMQFPNLKLPETHAQIRAVAADLMVVAAYGLILPAVVLEIPRAGCLNIHASLLPRWRGAAPIQRALLAGDAETGITIMQMDAGLDTGAMLLRTGLAIAATDTAQTLHDKLAALGAMAIVEALELLQQDRLLPEAQDSALATYAAKLSKDEAHIHWNQPAAQIERAVRAYNPVPGAFSLRDGEPLKLWAAEVTHGEGAPGTVLGADKDGIVVASAHGALRLTELQRASGKRLAVARFLAGMAIVPGERWT